MSRPMVYEMDAYMGISNATRRKMLELLGRRPRTAGEIGAHFDLSQPAVSQHLRVLRRARLVRQQRRGLRRVYTINPAPLRQVTVWVNKTLR